MIVTNDYNDLSLLEKNRLTLIMKNKISKIFDDLFKITK